MNAAFALVWESMQQLVLQLAALFPKVVAAILIWLIGNRLLSLGVVLLKRIDIKGTKIDNYLVAFATKIAIPLGKFILALIILDYLGIGRTVIAAFMNGLTLMIALALGISFGRALEEDAKNIVSEMRRQVKK